MCEFLHVALSHSQGQRQHHYTCTINHKFRTPGYISECSSQVLRREHTGSIPFRNGVQRLVELRSPCLPCYVPARSYHLLCGDKLVLTRSKWRKFAIPYVSYVSLTIPIPGTKKTSNHTQGEIPRQESHVRRFASALERWYRHSLFPPCKASHCFQMAIHCRQ